MWCDIKITSKGKTYYYKVNQFDNIYSKMMILTDNDHEISSDIASWAELATPGETYDFREGTAEIEDSEDECRARDYLF